MLDLELEPTAGRRAVALAHARVAHHGGAFADARARRVLDLAAGFARGAASLADVRAALPDLDAAAREARARMASRAWTIFQARRAGAAAEDYRAARAVADALRPVLDPAGCGTPAAVSVDPRWLTTDVLALASLAAAGQTDLLPILADALEDAGCAAADLLGHCRGPGPHDAGCWVLTLFRTTSAVVRR